MSKLTLGVVSVGTMIIVRIMIMNLIACTCEQRNQGGVRAKKCGGCHVARYCNDACALLNWPDHKRTCRATQLLAQRR